MKFLFSSLLVIACLISAQAQGNLQYNQTRVFERISPLNYQVCGTNSNHCYWILDSFSIIVPANKTLKLESTTITSLKQFEVRNVSTNALIFGGGLQPTSTTQSGIGVFVNNSLLYSTDANGNVPRFQVPAVQWLSAGTHTIKVTYNVIGGNGPTYTYANFMQAAKTMITALEFNIVP